MSIPQVYALTGLTVRKPMPEVKNPIGTADQEWIFACNCEGLNDHSTRTMDYSSLKTGLQPINDIKKPADLPAGSFI